MKVSKLVRVLIVFVIVLFIAVGFLSFNVVTQARTIRIYEGLPQSLQGEP